MKSKHSLETKRLHHLLNQEMMEELDEMNIQPVKVSKIREGRVPILHRIPMISPKDKQSSHFEI